MGNPRRWLIVSYYLFGLPCLKLGDYSYGYQNDDSDVPKAIKCAKMVIWWFWRPFVSFQITRQ